MFVILCNSGLFIVIPSAEFVFSLSSCSCQGVAAAGSVLHLAAQFRLMAEEHLQRFVFHQIVNGFCSDG